MPQNNVSYLLYAINDEHVMITILGATLEWVVLVRSDKRAHKYPKPTVADPSIRVHTSTTPSTTCHHLQYMIPNLPKDTDDRLTSNG